MAMYYQGSSEIQADGLQTLYLMNPNYLASYSETQNHPQPNTPFFNPLISALPPHAPPPQQFMGIPLSHNPSRPSPSQEDIQAAHNAIPRFHYNIWRGLVDHHQQSDYENLNQPNTPQQQQTPKGLSLSLTPHQTRFHKSNISSDHDHDFPGQIISPKNCPSDPNLTAASDHPQISGVNNTVQSVIMGSKYLKAAQELLDEVISVGKGTKSDRPKGSRAKAKMISTDIKESGGGCENDNKNGGVELTTAQRQEIQMKKAKLSSMLDEVEQRYKQYHHQMQIIVTSFEQIAGIGSAKSYTHLALKTILKQFRCLKNTISSQIKALSKSLGEEDNAGIKMDGSRLKFVDHHLRHQRTFQQLGMTHDNAWRPHRGLPERAVSVLRAWLLEHFLHPYPKDSDKHMLAKQTGLTKSQVSNWFINARVRLWKPMVEDMYMEEIKNQEIRPENNNTNKPGTQTGTRPDGEFSNSKSNPRQANINITNTPITNNLNTLQSMQNNKPTLNLVPISPSRKNMQNPPEKNPKKPRNENHHDNSPSSILSVDMETKPGEYQTTKGFDDIILGRENYLSTSGFSSTYGILVGELPDRFINFHHQHLGNNNFSLTLGLPPSETYSQGAHHGNFLSHRTSEFGTRIEPVESNNRVNGINNQADASHPNISNYEVLDFQNTKSFPAQLLPDHHFVA